MQREDLKQLNIPDNPGIYMFRGPKNKLLYIGKAASLRDRVRSYFASDLINTRSAAIAGMVAMATTLEWTETGSVLEALILEANEIKRHQPPYNVISKDNKSFNYLVLTQETFPQVLVVRGRDLFDPLKAKSRKLKAVFGPFTEGLSLKEALKIVRKIFPYRDSKCIPCGEKGNKNCRPCFNKQIGLCPGVCTGEVSKEEYNDHTVRNIKDLFSGNFHGLKRRLAREMQEAAKHERFEVAAIMRRQIHALEHVRDVSLIKGEHKIASGGGARIEAFDTAHTSGQETVAVMTIVNNGEMIKDAYRKFKIQTATNDDVGALREALSRRLNHAEWPLPRVFVVDGGTGQMNAARRVLRTAGLEIPIVGVVKNEFHKPERLIGDSRAIEAYERDILLANAEAHRFAIGFHRQRRRARMF
jgi:excinuclease ABC subunit C